MGLKCFRLLRGFIRTNFSISKKAFQNSDIVNLGDLEFVERSNKIRVEKLLNGLPIILGEYNAPTVGASCTLYNSAGVALGTASTGSNGQVNLVGVTSIPAGLVTMACRGGAYTDEATQQSKTLQPHLFMAAFRTPITSVALLPLVAAICEIIASVAPILPASSLATAPSLALLGMVLIISTPLKKTPKAVATSAFSFTMSLAILVSAI
jgi:hypothetical protein